MALKKGPPPEYGQPLKLRQAIDEYFEACKADGDVFPDYAGMKIFLRLTDDRVKTLLDSKNPNAEENRQIFEYATDRRKSWLSRRGAIDNRAAQGCKFLLMQEENGGLSDRPQVDNDKTLTIKGFDFDAFK